MKLTKYTHACVRLDAADRALVIDPGMWSEASSLDGADAVLITHEHHDHVDLDALTAAVAANPKLKVFTHADVVEQLDKLGEAVQTVAVGDEFEVAGFAVHAVGGEHAEIHDGKPGCANLGFLVGTGGARVYHPGDSLFVPSVEVDTLLVPISAPWLKLGEAIDFLEAVAPARAHPIHEALYSMLGNELADRWLENRGKIEYSRINPGDSVTIAD